MRTFAEFQIIGRIGKVKEVGPTLRVTIAAEYGKRDDRGDFKSIPFWNEVTIFNERTIKWALEHIGAGDLVHARGSLRQTDYEKDGQRIFGVTLAAEDFDLLRKKTEKPEGEEEDDDIPV
jgi:single-strand DNA-binding protein